MVYINEVRERYAYSFASIHLKQFICIESMEWIYLFFLVNLVLLPLLLLLLYVYVSKWIEYVIYLRFALNTVKYTNLYNTKMQDQTN